MSDFQPEWFKEVIIKRHKQEARWAMLPPARVTPEEKERYMKFCEEVLKMKYAVVIRIILSILWHKYRELPQARHTEVKEIDTAANEFMLYIPVIKKQIEIKPGLY